MNSPFSNDGFVPGNYAVIVKCAAAPELLMRTVRLEVCIPFGGIGEYGGIKFSNQEGSAVPAWIVTGENLLRHLGLSSKLIPSSSSCLGQDCLMPIKPEADPLSLTTETPTHEKS